MEGKNFASSQTVLVKYLKSLSFGHAILNEFMLNLPYSAINRLGVY